MTSGQQSVAAPSVGQNPGATPYVDPLVSAALLVCPVEGCTTVRKRSKKGALPRYCRKCKFDFEMPRKLVSKLLYACVQFWNMWYQILAPVEIMCFSQPPHESRAEIR